MITSRPHVAIKVIAIIRLHNDCLCLCFCSVSDLVHLPEQILQKVKYNKPWELAPVINQAFSTNSEKESA